MAYGLPVIIPDCTGIVDVCIPNHNAIILPRWKYFEKQLLDAIRQLLNDEALRYRLGENARATMQTRTWDWIAQETEKVYDRALERVKAQ
jgi:glycosyltransferase involved in cell wall biosynthesis